jgi:hypothetical protein
MPQLNNSNQLAESQRIFLVSSDLSFTVSLSEVKKAQNLPTSSV